MNAKHRARRLSRRRAHTEHAFENKALLLASTIRKAKAQRKGKAHVINTMEREGYVLNYRADHTDPHNWRRLPSRAPHVALERS